MQIGSGNISTPDLVRHGSNQFGGKVDTSGDASTAVEPITIAASATCIGFGSVDACAQASTFFPNRLNHLPPAVPNKPAKRHCSLEVASLLKRVAKQHFPAVGEFDFHREASHGSHDVMPL